MICILFLYNIRKLSIPTILHCICSDYQSGSRFVFPLLFQKDLKWIIKGKPLKKVTAVEEYYAMGMDTAVTPYGHTLPCYNVEGTLCDIFRADAEMQEKQFAVWVYLNGKKSLSRLMGDAKVFHVEKNQTVYGDTVVIYTLRQLQALIRNKPHGDNAKVTTLIRNFVMERLLERISFSKKRVL